MLYFALLRNIYIIQAHEDSLICYILEVCHFIFHIYDSSGSDFCVWFEVRVKDYFLSYGCPFLSSKNSSGDFAINRWLLCVGLCVDSFLLHWSFNPWTNECHMLLITITINYILISDSISPSILFFSIVFTPLGLLRFHLILESAYQI